MKKPKICFVFTVHTIIDTILRGHIVTLSTNFEIYLVTSYHCDLDNSIKDLPIKELKIIKIERNPSIISDLGALIKLYQYFEENKFDFVHTITPKASLLGQLAALFSGVDHRIHIFTGQVWVKFKGLKRFFYRTLDYLVARMTTVNLIDSYGQLEFLVSNKVISEKKYQILGNGSTCGANTSIFKKDAKQRRLVREHFKCNDETIVILFLGRLNLDKGIESLILAFEKMTEIIPNCLLILAGADEGNISATLGVENPQIIFAGHLDPKNGEVIDILQAADIFCLPSFREGFSISVIQASAMEIPVVCSDIYGLRDTLIVEKTGFTFNVDDVEDLKEKLIFLAKDKDLRKELGKRGRRFVERNFESSEIQQKWLDFYFELLESRKQNNKKEEPIIY